MRVSFDWNDTYGITLRSHGSLVWQATLPPGAEPPGPLGGLRPHSIEIPEAVARNGFDAIEIDATEGDGAYSIGHLVLDP